MSYTSIRVRRETKRLLERALTLLEARLGKRLDYDELLRILAERVVGGKPWLLEYLVENPVEDHDTRAAYELLRGERRRDEERLGRREASLRR